MRYTQLSIFQVVETLLNKLPLMPQISIGCDISPQCPSLTPGSIKLEFSRNGGSTPWQLIREPCLPSGPMDADCVPYVYHGPSTYDTDVYSTWTRVTVPMPEKTWSR